MADQQTGWYPDPAGDVTKLRYWDGMQWTEHLTDALASSPYEQPGQLPVQTAQPYQLPPQVMQQQVYQPQGALPQDSYYQSAEGQPWANQPGVQIYEKRSNGMAIASLVLGILGFCLLIPSIVAIILGALGMKKTHLKGVAIAGLVMGVSGVALWIFLLINGFITDFTEAFMAGYNAAGY